MMSALTAIILMSISLVGVLAFVFSTVIHRRVLGLFVVGFALCVVSTHLGYIYLGIIEFASLITIIPLYILQNSHVLTVDSKSHFYIKVSASLVLLMITCILLGIIDAPVPLTPLGSTTNLSELFANMISDYIISLMGIMIFGVIVILAIVSLMQLEKRIHRRER
jgi:hypothetical protein